MFKFNQEIHKRKKTWIIFLLVLIGAIAVWSLNLIPTYNSFPQGATIEIRKPSPINEWVSEIVKMTMIHDFAYISTENHGLQILDLSDPTKPNTIVSLYFHTKVSIKNIPSNFYLDGNLLYVGAGCTGGMLYVLDIVIPAKPTLIDAYYITCSGPIVVEDNKAYIGNNYSGLLVLDVSDPSDIKEQMTISVAELLDVTFGYRQGIPPVTSLAKNNNNFWIVIYGFTPTFLRIDTSNPSRLIVTNKKSGYPISGNYTYRPYEQLGDTIYFPSTTGIERQKIEFDSSLSKWISFEELSFPSLAQIPAFRITPRYLYLSSPEMGVKILNYHELNKFNLISEYQPSTFEIEWMYIDEDSLMLIGGEQSLQILAIAQNGELSVLFSFS